MRICRATSCSAARRTRTRTGGSGRWPRTALALLLLASAAACGKKAAPLPPEPRGPLSPTEVRARQIGSRISVGFVVPEARGDKPSQVPVRAEVIRVAYPPGVTPKGDPGAFRRRGELVATRYELRPGERVRLDDPQLSGLAAAGVGSSIRYGVRVRDRRGRLSPLVVAPDLVPLEPAPAPRNLRGEATADGIRLVWDAPTVGAQPVYHLYRRPVGAPPAEAPIHAQPLAAAEYLDGSVTTGARYVYEVRVALAGGAPYRESAGSAPLEINAEDRFPPAAPRGLVAVQEGDGVRLFWDPNAERDLRGYRLYREILDPAGPGGWSRIGPDPVERPLYLDETVRVGQRARYRVAAIDRAEPPNESPPSEAVELELEPEPPAPIGDAG